MTAAALFVLHQMTGLLLPMLNPAMTITEAEAKAETQNRRTGVMTVKKSHTVNQNTEIQWNKLHDLGHHNFRVKFMRRIIDTFNDYAAVMCAGALIYGMIEMVWRGHTHWTMLVLGGICFVVIYIIENNTGFGRLQKCALGALFITAAEFVTGLIVNVILGWGVWDYSDEFLNIAGQICPLFSLLWFILCIPGLRISSYLRSRISAQAGCTEQYYERK